MSKEELLGRIAELIRQVTDSRFEGAAYAKLARAHGYADGYMRALLDAQLVGRDELLAVVGQARQQSVDASDAAAARRAAA